MVDSRNLVLKEQANQVVPFFPTRSIQEIDKGPSTLDVVANTLATYYDPTVMKLGLGLKYAFQDKKEGYDVFADMGEYKGNFAHHLYFAKNEEHMSELKFTIDKTNEMRAVRDSGSFGQRFVGEIFDPINLFSFRLGTGLRTSQAALRGGVALGAIEASREALTYGSDPFKTEQESALNVLGATFMGGAFSAGGSALNARALRKDTELINAHYETLVRVDRIEGLTPEDLMVPRSQRVFGDVADDELHTLVDSFSAKQKELENQLEMNKDIPDEYRVTAEEIESSLESVVSYIRSYKNEIGIRELQGKSFDGNDPWNILPSFFTNSVLYKAVSTPMKRTLQSKYPNLIKENFVKGFNDSGLALMLNSVGIATPNSVAQRATVANGKWVMAHDKLMPIWAKETGASPNSRLDINPSDVARTVSRSDLTYRKWLTNLNERRIKKDPNLNEGEIEASSIIENYFKAAKKNLEDTGLITTKSGLENRATFLRNELESYKSRRTVARLRADEVSAKENRIIRQHIDDISDELAFTQKSLSKKKDTIDSDEDLFFPRFWDIGAIRKNREGLKRILTEHFTRNPKIEQFNRQTGEFETVQLSSSPKMISERVDSTISRILGEADGNSLENSILSATPVMGRGRAKHFKHRQLDIPNKLVLDYIHTDPLAVMKTYATRIEPRYEFQKSFGRSVDSVLDEMELEMLGKNFSEKEINKMRRDFNHMYDRVSGAVLRYPDALNRKVSNFLREAASFSYMGSSGLAAIPDFGRIVMEYDMENVVKGVQELMNKNTVKMTVDETRIAGEAIDILKGTAHMRMQEDLSNNIDANELLSSARNAFYILNGLAPLTGLAKQLSGIIDGHVIIDYSIRYKNLTSQERIWLNKYGIGEEDAKLIAKAPWEKTETGLYTANTREWDNISFEDVLAKATLDYKPLKKSVFNSTEKELLAHYGRQFNVDRIIMDQKIVDKVFEKQGPKMKENLLGQHVWFRDTVDDGTIYINKRAINDYWDNFHYRIGEQGAATKAENIKLAKEKLESRRELLDETTYYHNKNLLNLITEFSDKESFHNFILMHELHHGNIAKKKGQSNSQYEDEIDKAAMSYMTNQKELAINRIANKQFDSQVVNAQELVAKYRTALNSGVINTIMSGTPADKPIITDGVVYIPMRVAKEFGMKEDVKYKGYARIENGLMGLPFQFYSYTLANINKTVATLAQGQVKNRAIGMATMMGLAYMALSIRTPEYYWDQMTWQDRFARSFDSSGVMALYSDLFYTGMHTTLALGGPNITGGLLQPKFNQEKSYADAIIGFAGAGPSWAQEVVGGLYAFANGEYGEGAMRVARRAPGANLWFLKDDINQITRAWAN